MMKPLPVGDFRWVQPQLDDVLATPDDGMESYVLAVYIEYSDDLHDSHNDYPLASEAFVFPEVSI